MTLLPGLLPLLALGLGAVASDSVSYVDASLEFEGRLLNHRFVDIDGSGELSLCVALLSTTGRRELRFFKQSKRGFDSATVRSVSILEDVLAYGFADVRPEIGRELLFLTRTGAFSYSLTLDGYRGNIARLATEELIYDVPDSSELPFWAYTLEVAGGDHVLLPGRSEFAIWTPKKAGAEEGTDAYEKRAKIDVHTIESAVNRSNNANSGGGASVTGSGEIRVELNGGGNTLFLSESDTSTTLLNDDKSYRAPALVDLNGDGRRDLILQRQSTLEVFVADEHGIGVAPTRIEDFPEYLQIADSSTGIEFADLDGDGDLDLLVRIQGDIEGFENAEMRIFVLLNDGRRLFPEAATQVLRFEAAVLRIAVTDANADGRPDLLIRKFALPSMLETVTGLEFEMTYLAYFGTGQAERPFERNPALKQVEIFDENNFAEAIKSRRIELDCSGDGVPDLVELDINGRIVIRRLQHKSGFFSGDTWALDEAPWKSFETRGTVRSLDLVDLNGDGLGDIVSPTNKSLTIYLSSRTR